MTGVLQESTRSFLGLRWITKVRHSAEFEKMACGVGKSPPPQVEGDLPFSLALPINRDGSLCSTRATAGGMGSSGENPTDTEIEAVRQDGEHPLSFFSGWNALSGYVLNW